MAGPHPGDDIILKMLEEGMNMFEAIFVLVTLAILVVEIIEVRDKCEQRSARIWEETPFYLADGRTVVWEDGV